MTQGAGPIVLVVDDLAVNRELVDGLLDGRGYDVREARDGQEALASIREREPDVVLLDIDMPVMDGISVCRAIKNDPATRLLPVVLVLRSFRVLPFMVEARAYPWGRRYPATVLLYEVRGREESGRALHELAQALARGEGSPAVAGAERVD